MQSLPSWRLTEGNDWLMSRHFHLACDKVACGPAGDEPVIQESLTSTKNRANLHCHA